MAIRKIWERLVWKYCYLEKSDEYEFTMYPRNVAKAVFWLKVEVAMYALALSSLLANAYLFFVVGFISIWSARMAKSFRSQHAEGKFDKDHPGYHLGLILGGIFSAVSAGLITSVLGSARYWVGAWLF